MSEIFVGIDPSLKGNAVVIIDEQCIILKSILVNTHKECYINDDQRILDIFDQIQFIVALKNLKAVYVEGLSYMSVSQSLFERCGLLYLITTHLFRHDIKYRVVPPTTLKKFVTTDGHADKLFMMRVTKCRWGIDFKDDNLCDAYCLAQMAKEENTDGN